MKTDKLFQIGTFCFRIIYEDSLIFPENFMKFICENGTPQYTYEFQVVETYPEPEGQQLVMKEDLLLFVKDEREIRYIGMKGMRGFYACYREESADCARVFIHSTAVQMLVYDTTFLSLLAMERRLNEQDGMVLHCAYMEYQGEAILFSAPSETGKTTQANLWGQYRGGRTVNGDRSLLQKIDGRWMARGWPVCGSSKICYNEDTPIKAIVMLSQGKENIVERMDSLKAFSLIYSQLTINNWNKEAQLHAMDLLDSIIKEVPVFHLSCTISEEAVVCLEEALDLLA